MDEATKRALRVRIQQNNQASLIGRAFETSDPDQMVDFVDWLADLLDKVDADIVFRDDEDNIEED